MRRRRILVAVHEELVPPSTIEGLSDHEIAEYRTEYDVVTGLQDLGHEVHPVGIGDDVEALRAALAELRPHVVFNLLVEFHGAATYDQHVASYLELERVPYTGCNPRGLTLARDKAVSKTILRAAGVPVPEHRVFELGRRFAPPEDLAYPLFVKSLTEEASLGISQASIVRGVEALEKRVAFVHESVGTDAIVESYVDGRELYVGVLGNARLKTLPPWELLMENLPAGAPRIATRRVKWDLDYQREVGVANRRAEGLTRAQERELARIARASYAALGLSGYARLDLRMSAEGRFYVLEANPNPDLAYGEDLADAAEAAGIGYEELLERIVRLGMAYPAAWKSLPGPAPG